MRSFVSFNLLIIISFTQVVYANQIRCTTALVSQVPKVDRNLPVSVLFEETLSDKADELLLRLGSQPASSMDFDFAGRTNEILNIDHAYRDSLINRSKMDISQKNSMGVTNAIMRRANRMEKINLEIAFLADKRSRAMKDYFSRQDAFYKYKKNTEKIIFEMEKLSLLITDYMNLHSKSSDVLADQQRKLEAAIAVNQLSVETLQRAFDNSKRLLRSSKQILESDRNALAKAGSLDVQVLEPHRNPKFVKNYFETQLDKNIVPGEDKGTVLEQVTKDFLKFQKEKNIRIVDWDLFFSDLRKISGDWQQYSKRDRDYLIGRAQLFYNVKNGGWTSARDAYEAIMLKVRLIERRPADFAIQLADQLKILVAEDLDAVKDIPVFIENLEPAVIESEFSLQYISAVKFLDTILNLRSILKANVNRDLWNDFISKENIQGLYQTFNSFIANDYPLNEFRIRTLMKWHFKFVKHPARVYVFQQLLKQIYSNEYLSLWQSNDVIFAKRLDFFFESFMKDRDDGHFYHNFAQNKEVQDRELQRLKGLDLFFSGKEDSELEEGVEAILQAVANSSNNEKNVESLEKRFIQEKLQTIFSSKESEDNIKSYYEFIAKLGFSKPQGRFSFKLKIRLIGLLAKIQTVEGREQFIVETKKLVDSRSFGSMETSQMVVGKLLEESGNISEKLSQFNAVQVLKFFRKVDAIIGSSPEYRRVILLGEH
jgi:hypothetical protein